jgi:hypothetical protein
MTFSKSEPTMTTKSRAAAPDTEFTKRLKNEKSGCEDSTDFADAENQHLNGWRLHVATLSLLILVFLVQMESSIASTSILSITDQFGGFEKSSWVFMAYMLTYCGKFPCRSRGECNILIPLGFQMIWAKLSDITARRFALLMCLVIFTIS